MEINAGGLVMSVTRDTLTQIKGTRLEDTFSGRWDKQLPRDGNGRVFLDINPKCFVVVVGYLNERMIAPPDCSPEIMYLGEEHNTFLQQLLLESGLGDDYIVQSKIFCNKHKLGKILHKKKTTGKILQKKQKLGQDYYGRNENYEELEDKWKLIKFDNLPEETPHNINMDL